MAKTANVKTATILALGHALEAGARGEAGGAPSKDSIWGIAQVGNSLVSFSGRRGALVLRYMTHKQADLPELKAKFASKLAGEKVAVAYKNVTKTHARLLPDLAEQVYLGFYSARRAGKLNNTRATQALLSE